MRYGTRAPRIISRAQSCPYARKPLAFSTDGKQTKRAQRARSRIEHLTARLPRFLQGYTARLINAPLSHITSFLILHEVTAVVPLVGLTGGFHYLGWIPSWVTDGKWANEGFEKFSRYFRKKGWVDEEGHMESGRWWKGEGDGKRLIIEYVIIQSSCG